MRIPLGPGKREPDPAIRIDRLSFIPFFFSKIFCRQVQQGRANRIAGMSYSRSPSIDSLPGNYSKQIPNLEGLNVTIPYKQSVIPFLDSKENLRDGLKACNCIRIEEGKLIGYNTDTFGFQTSLNHC